MNRILLLLLVGCVGDPVVLAELPEESRGTEGARCVDTDDCASTDYCDKSACADAAGTCHSFPVDCGGDQKPVCGCDGVTYFNTCLRRAAGIEADVAGECDHGTSCETRADCPAGAECARLIGSEGKRCNASPRGACWVLPVSCAATPDRWTACKAEPPRCVDTCTAIRSGAAHKRALSCE